MGKDDDYREDTLKFYMRDTRETLAAVSTIIERGRIATKDRHRSLEKYGPWCIGTIYSTSILEIRLYVAIRIDTGPLPETTHANKAIYIGLKGLTMLHTGTGYSRMRAGSVSNIAAGVPHRLEPTEDGTQVLVIMVGEG